MLFQKSLGNLERMNFSDIQICNEVIPHVWIHSVRANWRPYSCRSHWYKKYKIVVMPQIKKKIAENTACCSSLLSAPEFQLNLVVCTKVKTIFPGVVGGVDPPINSSLWEVGHT